MGYKTPVRSSFLLCHQCIGPDPIFLIGSLMNNIILSMDDVVSRSYTLTFLIEKHDTEDLPLIPSFSSIFLKLPDFP